jgi:hypothetical protein
VSAIVRWCPRCTETEIDRNSGWQETEFLQEVLLEQVFCDDHALDLVGAFVDLRVLAESSTRSTGPVIVRSFVHCVHRINGGSPDL